MCEFGVCAWILSVSTKIWDLLSGKNVSVPETLAAMMLWGYVTHGICSLVSATFFKDYFYNDFGCSHFIYSYKLLLCFLNSGICLSSPHRL